MPDQTDPIQFEVIRNALLEATEEMAIALRRSAYSTNIKTRADFSCAFFDRQLRPVAQAFTQPVHLGSLTILHASRSCRIRPGEPAGRRRDPRQRPLSRRSPSQRHHADFTRLLRRRTLRLRSQPRPSRRCRRRCTGQHWSLPAGVSGGHHHPAGKAGARRGNRDRCL